MIKLTNLNEEIKTLKGIKIAGFDDRTPLTIKDALLTICEMAKNLLPGESIKVFDIALKINASKDSLELAPEQFDLLKKVVNNSDIFVAGILGKLIQYLENCSKVESK